MGRLFNLSIVALLAVLALPVSSRAQETVEYYGLDALGSVRVIFDAQGGVVARMDYGPFGENLREAIKFPTEQFAQLNRDAESGQDYAQARNYSPGTGRFNRVDPVYAGLFDPQALNRYSYALNRPFTFVDPSGLVPCGVGRWCVETIEELRNGTDAGELFYVVDQGAHDGGTQGPVPPPPPPIFTPDVPSTDPDTPKDVPPEDEGPNLVLEFAKGCAQGAAGLVDGVIPWADPLQSSGAYTETSPAAWWSQPIGEHVRNFAVAELSAGVLLARGAHALARAGRLGHPVAKTWSSGNRYLRLGHSRLGSGPYTPTLRIGNFQSPTGRFFSHVDLTPGKVWSDPSITPKKLQALKGCVRW